MARMQSSCTFITLSFVLMGFYTSPPSLLNHLLLLKEKCLGCYNVCFLVPAKLKTHIPSILLSAPVSRLQLYWQLCHADAGEKVKIGGKSSSSSSSRDACNFVPAVCSSIPPLSSSSHLATVGLTASHLGLATSCWHLLTLIVGNEEEVLA